VANYRSPDYKEAELRQEFINPLFECLGWDMANKRGHAEAYKDVVHEESIKIGANMKAPDYSFRVGGSRKFFLEAKKPAVGIKSDSGPAYQLRRYAWSAKLPLSILTNFAEFAVYECKKKPDQNDKAATGRIHYFRHTEYVEKWDEIADIFSKDAVLKGSFDRYAEAGGRRGTATVDSAFLAEIEEWRGQLARNIAVRNPTLSQRDLNFAVQITIDRIIFLRICEDRGVEAYGQLQDLLRHTEDVYAGLLTAFKCADTKYNSGLFHFDDEDGRDAPDALTPGLVIDDKVLKDIIKGLYFPESPYEFSVISADILGQVYEQFLGKVIRLTDNHTAKVEDKPEVRKAGGVYYTPTYIVRYIVEQTVGKLLGPANVVDGATMTPKQARKLRVLDPACGSGSFLLGAYDYLLDWHRDRYIAEGPENHKKELVALPGGGYRLTTAERKRILKTNIYGVDIDPQAVEVTKLSLLLKVLEGETQQSLQALLFSKERVLPDLDDTIRCGNSLIGGDYYADKLELINNEEHVQRVNAFDWKIAFPKIMKAGGFDAVIGNPPYVLLQGELRDDLQLEYYRKSYPAASYKIDTYHLFLDKGTRLTKPKGVFSMITPSNYLTNNFLAPLRKYLLESTQIDHVLVLDRPVFAGVSVDTAILVVNGRAKPSESFLLVHADPAAEQLKITSNERVSASRCLQDKHVLFTCGIVGVATALWDRLTQHNTTQHNTTQQFAQELCQR